MSPTAPTSSHSGANPASAAAGHAPPHGRIGLPSPHRHHFSTLAQQTHASRLGMWIFLGTEVLLFGGLFAAYVFYRNVYPIAWEEASRHLDTTLGTIETFDLVTSSLLMAMSIHFVRTNRRVLATGALGLTIAMGLAFLVMHSFEYLHEYHVGALPGRYYHYAEVTVRGANLFYTLYFLMTGLHSVHVIAGVGVLGVLAWFTWRGEYTSWYHTPLELGGLYWHLVDLIWIFLYPLLYLV